MQKYEIEVYVTKNGRAPFTEWLNGLRNKTVQAKLAARIRRASFGNFGDSKRIRGAKGIFEIREHYAAGYRIFYSLEGNKIILLLAGSSKKDQNKAIAKAKQYRTDYLERKNDD